MTSNDDNSAGETTEGEYIETDELTVSIESPLLDITLTENNLSHEPVINTEPDPHAETVNIHLPFFIDGVESHADELAFSENFIHTQLTKQQAQELHQQLEHALDEL